MFVHEETKCDVKPEDSRIKIPFLDKVFFSILQNSHYISIYEYYFKTDTNKYVKEINFDF